MPGSLWLIGRVVSLGDRAAWVGLCSSKRAGRHPLPLPPTPWGLPGGIPGSALSVGLRRRSSTRGFSVWDCWCQGTAERCPPARQAAPAHPRGPCGGEAGSQAARARGSCLPVRDVEGAGWEGVCGPREVSLPQRRRGWPSPDALGLQGARCAPGRAQMMKAGPLPRPAPCRVQEWFCSRGRRSGGCWSWACERGRRLGSSAGCGPRPLLPKVSDGQQRLRSGVPCGGRHTRAGSGALGFCAGRPAPGCLALTREV